DEQRGVADARGLERGRPEHLVDPEADEAEPGERQDVAPREPDRALAPLADRQQDHAREGEPDEGIADRREDRDGGLHDHEVGRPQDHDPDTGGLGQAALQRRRPPADPPLEGRAGHDDARLAGGRLEVGRLGGPWRGFRRGRGPGLLDQEPSWSSSSASSSDSSVSFSQTKSPASTTRGMTMSAPRVTPSAIATVLRAFMALPPLPVQDLPAPGFGG